MSKLNQSEINSKQQEKERIYYFAYGSNMDSDRIKNRIDELPPVFSAILKGYQLVFNKKAAKNPKEGYANIEKDTTSHVEGKLYSISSDQLQKLDKIEKVPDHYQKISIIVFDKENNQYSAITYQAVENQIRPNLKPSKEYLKHLLNGKSYLTQDYYNKLQRQETID